MTEQYISTEEINKQLNEAYDKGIDDACSLLKAISGIDYDIKELIVNKLKVLINEKK